MTNALDDLLAANRSYAASFDRPGLPGAAGAGILVVTCMDSRIDPLAMLGLGLGDAKIVRNPGGRVTDAALEAVILGVNLLGATTVLVVPHTRCAVATNSEEALRTKLAQATGSDVSWVRIPVTEGQDQALKADVERVRSHPLVSDAVTVAGLVYDVDTGLLEKKY